MAQSRQFDRERLLERLDRIQFTPEQRKHEELDQLSLAGALLALAEINHEREYQLCQMVAKHLLGKVPEPDEVGPDEE